MHRHSVDEPQFEQVMHAVKASPELVELGVDTRGHTRFSTKTLLALEQTMVKDASVLAQDQNHSVNLLIQRQVLDTQNLSTEQQSSYTHLLTQGDVACVVGFAGSGKSTLLGATRQAWETAGYRVQGMTLSGIAAENLTASSDIASHTIANRLLTWQHDRERLGKRDVVVLDEAGMVGSRQMAAILSEVKQAGAKLVLLGDPEQLQAIDAGAAFRAIAQRVGYVELQTIHRQRELWQQAAVKQLALGQTAAGLQSYQANHHTHAYATRQAAQEAMVADWQETRTNQPDKSLLMLAYTRKEVQQLNEMARAARIDNGEISQGTTVTTERGERSFASGDIIYFLRNDKDLGVKNGTLGTIAHQQDNTLWIKINGEQHVNKSLVQVDVADYPYLDHGYAATIHKAQGSTVDRSFVLASPHFDRHVTYVALSRHRDGAELYWSEDVFSSFEQLCQRLSRAQHKDITLDYSVVRDIEQTPEHAPEQTLSLQVSVTTDINPERLREAENRLTTRAQKQTQVRELQAGIDTLSRELGRPISHELPLSGAAIYHGLQDVGGRTFGVIEQIQGFKLVDHELCKDLIPGTDVKCLLDVDRQLQVLSLNMPEMDKSTEQTLPDQSLAVKQTQKTIDKEIDMEMDR